MNSQRNLRTKIISTKLLTVEYGAWTDILTMSCCIYDSEKYRIDGKLPLEPPRTEFLAMWDTGATNSMISPSVVDMCGLEPHGTTEVTQANDDYTAEIYTVNIELPNELVLENVQVAKADLTDIDVLIGMDIIGLGDFAISHPYGKTKLSFRFPSVSDLDFARYPDLGLIRDIDPDRER